jgi:hypothetical protein
MRRIRRKARDQEKNEMEAKINALLPALTDAGGGAEARPTQCTPPSEAPSVVNDSMGLDDSTPTIAEIERRITMRAGIGIGIGSEGQNTQGIQACAANPDGIPWQDPQDTRAGQDSQGIQTITGRNGSQDRREDQQNDRALASTIDAEHADLVHVDAMPEDAGKVDGVAEVGADLHPEHPEYSSTISMDERTYGIPISARQRETMHSIEEEIERRIQQQQPTQLQEVETIHSKQNFTVDSLEHANPDADTNLRASTETGLPAGSPPTALEVLDPSGWQEAWEAEIEGAQGCEASIDDARDPAVASTPQVGNEIGGEQSRQISSPASSAEGLIVKGAVIQRASTEVVRPRARTVAVVRRSKRPASAPSKKPVAPKEYVQTSAVDAIPTVVTYAAVASEMVAPLAMGHEGAAVAAELEVVIEKHGVLGTVAAMPPESITATSESEPAKLSALKTTAELPLPEAVAENGTARPTDGEELPPQTFRSDKQDTGKKIDKNTEISTVPTESSRAPLSWNASSIATPLQHIKHSRTLDWLHEMPTEHPANETKRTSDPTDDVTTEPLSHSAAARTRTPSSVDCEEKATLGLLGNAPTVTRIGAKESREAAPNLRRVQFANPLSKNFSLEPTPYIPSSTRDIAISAVSVDQRDQPPVHTNTHNGIGLVRDEMVTHPNKHNPRTELRFEEEGNGDARITQVSAASISTVHVGAGQICVGKTKKKKKKKKKGRSWNSHALDPNTSTISSVRSSRHDPTVFERLSSPKRHEEPQHVMLSQGIERFEHTCAGGRLSSPPRRLGSPRRSRARTSKGKIHRVDPKFAS